MMRCQRKQVKKGRRKKKKVAKKVHESEDDSEKETSGENTFDEDDTLLRNGTSTVMMMILCWPGSLSYGLVPEKILDYIIIATIPEVTTILKGNPSSADSVMILHQTGRDPKNPTKPKNYFPKILQASC
jgi:hypothetical protein